MLDSMLDREARALDRELKRAMLEKELKRATKVITWDPVEGSGQREVRDIPVGTWFTGSTISGDFEGRLYLRCGKGIVDVEDPNLNFTDLFVLIFNYRPVAVRVEYTDGR